MKKSIIAAVLMISVAALANAALNPAGTVVGSSHDLSVASDLGGQGQICVFCHTPHNANKDATTLPLWSRSLSAKTFTPYFNTDFSAITAGVPGAISKACLGCHDGSIALGYIANGAFNSVPVTGGPNLFNGNHGARDAGGDSILVGDAMNIGGSATTNGDLSTTHPIGFTYPGAQPLKFKDVVSSLNVKLFKEGSSTANQVECATCHEPHNQGNLITTDSRYFLRSTNVASALCTTCHIK